MNLSKETEDKLMNMNNAIISSISTNSKEDTSMKNATVYYATRNAVNNFINPDSPNYISELNDAVKNNTIPVTDEYWIECQKYARKCLAKTPSEKLSTLKTAYGYEYDDLVDECTIRLFNRFQYLVGKFFETLNCSPEDAIKRFNGAVALIIPSFLTEMWRKVSSEQEYEETDTLTAQKTKKRGKGLHKTLLTTSIDQNNSSDSDEDVTLLNTLISNEPSAEAKLISRESIMNYISVIADSPRELLGFMCVMLDISADDIIDMMSEGMSMTYIFSQVCSRFSAQFDIPSLMYLAERFTEESLTYSGVMSQKKQLSNERSSGKKKVKQYILSLNNEDE